MINNHEDDDYNDDNCLSSEQKTAKRIPQPIDAKNMNSIEIRKSDNSNMEKIIVFNYDKIHKPEVSYASMHNGLSSPEPNENDKIEPSTDLNELKSHLSSSNLFVLEKPISNDDFVEVYHSDEKTEDYQLNSKAKDNIITLYDNILHSNISQILQSFYVITEKEEVKDTIIGFYKLYEISLYTKLGNEKEAKCYRRYDNFHKLHQKLKNKYPYIMIPRLTPKNPLVKIMKFEDEFYENRRLQLIFYLNFIANHSMLSKTKEYNKFINEANFDDAYFSIDESPMNSLLFSSSASDMIKTKLITVWNYIGTTTTRKLNDSEILINKMTIHYRNIIDKYNKVKNATFAYIKSIKEETNEYKGISDTLYYIKDAFEYVEGSKDKLVNYSNYSNKIYSVHNGSYCIANRLENKLEALISFLLGICDSFDKYAEFIKRYENVTTMLNNAKENNWENINVIINEYDSCEILKNKFDVHLTKEANEYIDLFDDMSIEILDQFKSLLMNINKEILE